MAEVDPALPQLVAAVIRVRTVMIAVVDIVLAVMHTVTEAHRLHAVTKMTTTVVVMVVPHRVLVAQSMIIHLPVVVVLMILIVVTTLLLTRMSMAMVDLHHETILPESIPQEIPDMLTMIVVVATDHLPYL